MVNTDPAIEAARRTLAAWGEPETNTESAATALTAAREALAPIRKLHRKVGIFDSTDYCDDDTSEHESQHHFEAINGEMVCDHLPPYGWTCAECAEIASGDDDDPPAWPCDTAKLIYTTEELQ
ncbi:MAG: hypothetical protein WBA38_04225 [Gordonia sp. (in: high G+C Gram-positive bacteria)]|uniref:hypothetical protein n=1 Tax=Gordonia sp. (in: high G+C Gram-positive bacteria) TaxID=84139 RepID=UPI003C71FEBC